MLWLKETLEHNEFVLTCKKMAYNLILKNFNEDKM